MKKEILDRFLSDLDHSSPETRRSREFWAKKFLASAPEDLSQWDRRIVLAFEKSLRKEGKGYATLTIRTALGVVKRVFDAAKAVHEQERTRLISQADPNNPSAVAEILKAMSMPGPQWDLGKRWMPHAESNNKATLSLEEIEKIVALAKGDGLEPPEVAFTALASVYGCRQGELQAVRQEHINYQEGTIFILTEKGGERRWQTLCPALIPYLQKYDFRWEYPPYKMNQMFKGICDKTGVPNRDGLAWHGFRNRALTVVRDSLARVADEVPFNIDYALAAKIFFRWRLSTSPEMAERYYTPERVLDIDTFVLEHHPIAKLWLPQGKLQWS